MRAHDDERLGQTNLAWRVCHPVIAALASMLAASCAQLTEPEPAPVRPADDVPAAAQPSGAPPAAPPPVSPAAPGEAPAAAHSAETIEASHILVAYQGAARARPTVTRTRDEARELADKLAARAHEPGVDFALLAKDFSDGPSGVDGGALPAFGREQMVKPFSDAAFALRPGEVSGVVETNFGFHVIQRTR